MIQAAEEVVEHAKNNNLSRQEVIDTENEQAKAVQAKNSQYRVQKVGLNAEAHIASPITRMVEPTFNQCEVCLRYFYQKPACNGLYADSL